MILLLLLHLVLLLNIQLLYIILRCGINTGDFFYDNILTDSKLVTFINGENSPAGLTSSYAGFNYIVFDSAVSLTGIISVPSSVSIEEHSLY
jgi:hypothetical protein